MIATDERPATSYRVRHKKNPYQTQEKAYSTTVFCPDEYTLSQIMNLSARALRVLMIIAAHHDPLTGICRCPKLVMRRFVSMSKANLSHAAGELIEADFIAKGQSLDTYYLNPSAYRAIHYTY